MKNNDILDDIRLLQTVESLPVSEIDKLKSSLKTTSYAQVYLHILAHQWPVKVKSKVACSTRLLDNSGDETLYQQGGTDHEQSIHDILGVIEAVSEIPF
jgi:hypothetical protein